MAPLVNGTQQKRELVGLGRFELPTSRLSSARSNQLSYRPMLSTRLPQATETTAGNSMLQRRLDSVGSSEKKEKRRRRSPAKDQFDLTSNGPQMFPKRSDRDAKCALKDHP
jgi:hypothetical protein